MIRSNYMFNLKIRPWPIILSIFSLNFITSLLIFIKFFNINCLLIRIVIILLSTILWWKDWSSEQIKKGMLFINLENSIKIAIILFITSEVILFLRIFWRYFHYKLSPVIEIRIKWPPIIIFRFNATPIIRTSILLTSRITVTIRHELITKNIINKIKIYIIISILLGFIFRFFQLLEYKNSFFSISDSNFGTVFYILTGLHGIHVIIGFIFLSLNLMKLKKITIVKIYSVSIEIRLWYWHFVDLIWIFLFYLIYYKNRI